MTQLMALHDIYRKTKDKQRKINNKPLAVWQEFPPQKLQTSYAKYEFIIIRFSGLSAHAYQLLGKSARSPLESIMEQEKS